MKDTGENTEHIFAYFYSMELFLTGLNFQYKQQKEHKQ